MLRLTIRRELMPKCLCGLCACGGEQDYGHLCGYCDSAHPDYHKHNCDECIEEGANA